MFAHVDPQLPFKMFEEFNQVPPSQFDANARNDIFFFVFAIVFSALLFRYLVARMRHKQILAAINKGLYAF